MRSTQSLLIGLMVASACAASTFDHPVIMGSIATNNSAHAGIRSLVLERGRWWRTSDPARDGGPFASSPSEEKGDGRATWLSDQCRGNVYLSMPPAGAYPCPVSIGILEVIGAVSNRRDLAPLLRTEGVGALAASGIGGGSRVYNGVSYPPLKAACHVAFPSGEPPHMQDVWSELSDQRYFDRVLAMIQPSHVPADILEAPLYAGTRKMSGMQLRLATRPMTSRNARVCSSRPAMHGSAHPAAPAQLERIS